MWASWVKSPARIHNHHNRVPSFDFAAADSSFPPSSPVPRSPLHHHYSASFKDVETLLNPHHYPNYPPLSPLHKYSLSFKPSPSPTRTQTHTQPVSFKDIQTLLTESNPTRKPSIFHRVKAWATRAHHPPPPDAQNRVVVYYTSLRVVRKTFDECRAVRSIVKGYKIKIDERDVSMDGGFLDELQRIIGNKSETMKDVSLVLPRVYVNGVYLGGADEIRRLHEAGDLKRLIQGLPEAEGAVCGGCGGFRFILCEECDGSHRVYREKVGFRSCSRCNQNGLIKCPSCTSVLF